LADQASTAFSFFTGWRYIDRNRHYWKHPCGELLRNNDYFYNCRMYQGHKL
jgi:hypothetical protein